MVNKRAGFSLIELLIAMAIMSMTLLIASLGFSFFMDKWQGNLGHFDRSAKLAKKLLLTKQAISGIAPYVLTNGEQQKLIYFEGNEDSMVGVTTRAFFVEKLPSIFRFTITQQDDFTYQLIYEEAALQNSPLINLSQTINYDHKVILLTDLADIQFSYFGYKDSNERIKNVAPQWWQSFNALSRNILPTSIKITFIYKEKQEYLSFPVAQIDPRILVLFSDKF